MALFQRTFYQPEPSFGALFRLFDDFENYSRETQPRGHGRRHRVFNPRFDVRESEAAYELHGELPGVDAKDVSIEFTEPQTMVVRGHVERNYTAGTQPAAEQAPVEDAEMSGAITPGSEISEKASHQATVADEETETAKENGEEAFTVVDSPKKEEAKKEEAPKPKERFHHQERSTGSFSRTFNFPLRVNEDEVTARLNNGVLHVTVPKAAKHETRRIDVN